MKLFPLILNLTIVCLLPAISNAQDNQHQLTVFEEKVVNEALAVVNSLSLFDSQFMDYYIDEFISASWMNYPIKTASSPRQIFLSTYKEALGAEVCEKLRTHDCYAEFIYVDPEDGMVIYPEDTADSNWLNLSWVFPTQLGLTSVVFSFKESQGKWILTKVKV